MKIVIKETNERSELSIINNSGVNYIADLIGIWNGWSEFEWNAEKGAYICSQETFNYWQNIINAQNMLDNRMNRLCAIHGSTAVYDALEDIDYSDLEQVIKISHKRLDEAFGPEPTI